MTRRMDLGLCEELVRRGCAGDSQACRDLVSHLWPIWVEMVQSSRSMGPFARSQDHVDSVLTRLIDKLGQADGRGLRHYPAWRDSHPEKTFEDWMRIVLTNLVRDYAREQLGPRSIAAGEPSPKRLLNEFSLSCAADELGVRPPVTLAQTARELLEFARSRLPPLQIRSLELWLEGTDLDQMDDELALAPGQARKLLRAGLATLRRHFARQASGEKE